MSGFQQASKQANTVKNPVPTWQDGACEIDAAPFLPASSIHVLPSLSMGGAERMVLDIALAAGRCPGQFVHIIVLGRSAVEYSHPPSRHVTVHDISGSARARQVHYIADLVRRMDDVPVYAHLLRDDLMHDLAVAGVRTIPVVHNATAGWKSAPGRWRGPAVPFAVACGEAVRNEMLEAGCRVPVVVMRHIRGARATRPGAGGRFRAALGLTGDDVVIGMVGRVVEQKRYDRAVRVLSVLRQIGVPAHLVIVGRQHGPENEHHRSEVVSVARSLGMDAHVTLTGAIDGVDSLLDGFDCFLNTSDREGLSIACQEAAQSGLPIVLSDVGCQGEMPFPRCRLLPSDADPSLWADAIVNCMSEPVDDARTLSDATLETAARHMAVTWQWMPALGPGIQRETEQRVLFVTGNLNVGGAQRSLCNLAQMLGMHGYDHVVAVSGAVGVPDFMTQARASGTQFVSTAGGDTPMRVARILSEVRRTGAEIVCFWNMDALTKMMVCKVLAGGATKVVDVSPGPMLFSEMQAIQGLTRYLSTRMQDYLDGLDVLVSKYRGGLLPRGSIAARQAVIPNGVFIPDAIPDTTGIRPPEGFDPRLSAVTVGRLTLAKKPWLLPGVARELERILPGSSLTVVGAIHKRMDGAWERMLEACGGEIPHNLFFVGGNARTGEFLPGFAAFYMVSEDQGCPNASLEALSCGLPVVANPNGGTTEQVVDGLTGYLVDDEGPSEEDLARAMALHLAWAMDHRHQLLDAAGIRKDVARRFSMETMASRYMALFDSLMTGRDSIRLAA